jgi:NAD(P)-dependent dehydrogenase (short-subunit alcohol dehydrogenase family)
MLGTRFTDKVCLVTGGGSGIGRAACQRFGAEEGRVAVVDLNEDHAKETAGMITSAGGQAMAVRADVGSSADIQAAIRQTVDTWDRLDVIVNDAAMMTFTPLLDTAEEAFEKVLAVNLTSVFRFCKYGIPHMPKGGAVVNVSSVHAHQTTPNVVPYATSKGGMEALTRGLSIELAPRGIRINCVAPGAVDTPMLRDNPNVKSGAEKITGAVGKPENLAAAICFLAAPEAAFVTGTTLVVDGGRLCCL